MASVPESGPLPDIQVEGVLGIGCFYGGVWPNCLAPPRPGEENDYLPGGGDPDPAGSGGADEDDPCNTGLLMLDAPGTQEGFASIWSKSGFGLPMAQRRERGGWLIRDPDGSFRLQEFPDSWQTHPCQINVPASATVPAGAVALVHTHPYSRGEQLTGCPTQSIPGVGSFHVNYTGDSSIPDDSTMLRLREHVSPAMIGIMIDNDEIVAYNGSSAAEPTRRPRCGY
ncbi:MAG TPA: hypothetical protein VFQ39_20380 [Longimicrobium sp.]|nr:hypothetical protein [Longimicrobium sp.]